MIYIPKDKGLIILFYENGDFFVFSIKFVLSDEFDFLWKKTLSGTIKKEELNEMNKKKNNTNTSTSFFSRVRFINFSLLIFPLVLIIRLILKMNQNPMKVIMVIFFNSRQIHFME